MQATWAAQQVRGGALVPGHNDVGGAAAGRDEAVLRGLDEARVLRNDAAQVAATVLDVAQDAPRQAQVVVRVHVDLRMLDVFRYCGVLKRFRPMQNCAACPINAYGTRQTFSRFC